VEVEGAVEILLWLQVRELEPFRYRPPEPLAERCDRVREGAPTAFRVLD
jgi:hypothetical protein